MFIPRTLKFIPTLEATPDYADADFMGGINVLTNILPDSSGVIKLVSVVVIDAAKQKPVFDLMFFNALPTVASAENASLDITAAQMVAKFIGRVSIASADYEDTANTSDATKRSIDLILQGSVDGGTSLWCVCQSQGAPNFAAATNLTIQLGYEVYRG